MTKNLVLWFEHLFGDPSTWMTEISWVKDKRHWFIYLFCLPICLF